MSKNHPFSIFLLKPGFNAGNALNSDHGLKVASATSLPMGAELYILDNMPKPPWWKEFFGITTDLKQVSKGALIFLPVGQNYFAISFGHVFHNLKDEAYEYDFGLRVTLNAVDPNKLKSTDVIEPGSSRRKRTQVPNESDLTYFDFDSNATIIKSLVGKIKDEYRDFISTATGSSNIHISLSVKPNQLPELCARLLTLYRSDAYKTHFPNIHNVEPVKDPTKIKQLNIELLKACKEKREEFYLTVPDILNYDEGLFVSFSGAGESLRYDDLSTSHYYEYLESKNIELQQMTEEILKAHKLVLVNENGEQKYPFRIYNCIAVDICLTGDPHSYHLCDGSWYKVEHEYIAKMQTFLNPYFEDREILPFDHGTEGKYNRAVPVADGRFICLDETSINPPGSTGVEPCDLYIVEDEKATLWHIKVSTRSASLSHLFNQGLNSVELIESEDESRDKLSQLVKDNIGTNNGDTYLKPIMENNYKVVYAIVTKKDKSNKSKNLPLFSQISLMRSIKTLTLMKIPVVCCFIEDKTEKKPGQKKKRKTAPNKGDGSI